LVDEIFGKKSSQNLVNLININDIEVLRAIALPRYPVCLPKEKSEQTSALMGGINP